VFTARYALSPYIKQIRFVFKGLITIHNHVPKDSASQSGPFPCQSLPLQHSLRPSQFIRRHTAFVTRASVSQAPLNTCLRAPVPSTPMTSLSCELRATEGHAGGIFRLACPSVKPEPKHGKQWRNICPRDTITAFEENFSLLRYDAVYSGSTVIMEAVSKTSVRPLPNFTALHPRKQEAL
jgi:hypothetical protein